MNRTRRIYAGTPGGGWRPLPLAGTNRATLSRLMPHDLGCLELCHRGRRCWRRGKPDQAALNPGTRGALAAHLQRSGCQYALVAAPAVPGRAPAVRLPIGSGRAPAVPLPTAFRALHRWRTVAGSRQLRRYPPSSPMTWRARAFTNFATQDRSGRLGSAGQRSRRVRNRVGASRPARLNCRAWRAGRKPAPAAH
jgi:hypothetical protein